MKDKKSEVKTMISNEQRAHDIALALMAKNVSGKDPVAAYQQYVNYLLPILKQIDKDFPLGILEHPEGDPKKKPAAKNDRQADDNPKDQVKASKDSSIDEQ